MCHACHVEKTLHLSRMVIDFALARSSISEQRQKWKTVLQIVTVSVICYNAFTKYTDSVANLKLLVHGC